LALPSPCARERATTIGWVSATARREELKELLIAARQCTRCHELAATRSSVVFGAGNADAELMFVGEAPGANEDIQGLPFVGAAGKLLEQLLADIGLSRSEVFIANVLKCRPPGNRDPQPAEIENCKPYLVRQIELIEPRVICTLGNFATKLLRGHPAGITRVHGEPEVRTIGSHTFRLYPLFHPAAALYTPSTLETLRADFVRLPAILALAPAPPIVPEPPVEPEPAGPPVELDLQAEQLGLF
jgi:DNA polymerase